MLFLDLPCSLHFGNAGTVFIRLSNQLVDQAINAVRQQIDHLESLFIRLRKVNDISMDRFVSRKATGIKDRSLKFVDVKFRDFIGKLVASRAEIVDQSLCCCSEHCACGSGRILKDGLRFVKDFRNILWHVFMSFNTLKFWECQFVINPKGDVPTVGTLTNTKAGWVIKTCEIIDSN